MTAAELEVYKAWRVKSNEYLECIKEKYPQISLMDLNHFSLVHLTEMVTISGDKKLRDMVLPLLATFIHAEQYPAEIERKLKLI